MENPKSRQERELGDSFAEFLGAMQFLSGNNQSEMAEGLGMSQQAYSLIINRTNIPRKDRDETIQEVFGLTDEERMQLRINSLQRDPTEANRKRILGSFAVRIRSGDPPLNEYEANLLKSLLGIEE